MIGYYITIRDSLEGRNVYFSGIEGPVFFQAWGHNRMLYRNSIDSHPYAETPDEALIYESLDSGNWPEPIRERLIHIRDTDKARFLFSRIVRSELSGEEIPEGIGGEYRKIVLMNLDGIDILEKNHILARNTDPRNTCEWKYRLISRHKKKPPIQGE